MNQRQKARAARNGGSSVDFRHGELVTPPGAGSTRGQRRPSPARKFRKHRPSRDAGIVWRDSSRLSREFIRLIEEE